MTSPSDLFQPLSRSTDPETSKAAADSVRGKTDGLERLIVATLRRIGAATSSEIQEHLHVEGLIDGTTQVHKRMAALRRRGRIHAIGVSRSESTGRAQTLYIAPRLSV